MNSDRVSSDLTASSKQRGAGTPRPPVAPAFAFRLATLIPVVLALALGACSNKDPDPPLQGYIEGEFALVAAPSAGTLARLHVRRGESVSPGAALFALESANEQAARREAVQRLRSAEERLGNLRGGRRPAEVEVVSAQAEQAEAARKLSAEQFRQQERLFAGGFISKGGLDQARANYERDIARLAEAEAQGKVARQALGRDAEIRAAAAEVEAARAALAQSEWRLTQRSLNWQPASTPTVTGGMASTGTADTDPSAATAAKARKANTTPTAVLNSTAQPRQALEVKPAAGVAALVQDTFFVEGEWVPAGRPVLSLLPAGNVKARFFLPEQKVGSVRQGDRVTLACDGCGEPIAATVSFVSSKAEYTPPVIYSKESRAKLVFMVEARPAAADAARMRPGQPVDVRLAGGQAASVAGK